MHSAPHILLSCTAPVHPRPADLMPARFAREWEVPIDGAIPTLSCPHFLSATPCLLFLWTDLAATRLSLALSSRCPRRPHSVKTILCLDFPWYAVFSGAFQHGSCSPGHLGRPVALARHHFWCSDLFASLQCRRASEQRHPAPNPSSGPQASAVAVIRSWSIFNHDHRYGIRAIDTSVYYGDSEIVLGNVLEKLRDEFPRDSYKLVMLLSLQTEVAHSY